MCPDCLKPTKRDGSARGDVCPECWQWRLDMIASAERGERDIRDVQRDLAQKRLEAEFAR